MKRQEQWQERKEDDADLKSIADIKKDPNWRDRCTDWDDFYKNMEGKE